MPKRKNIPQSVVNATSSTKRKKNVVPVTATAEEMQAQRASNSSAGDAISRKRIEESTREIYRSKVSQIVEYFRSYNLFEVLLSRKVNEEDPESEVIWSLNLDTITWEHIQEFLGSKTKAAEDLIGMQCSRKDASFIAYISQHNIYAVVCY